METGKLNALSAEDKAGCQAAKAALAEAQEKLKAWAEQSARSRQISELWKQYVELVKAVDDAENIATRYDL